MTKGITQITVALAAAIVIVKLAISGSPPPAVQLRIHALCIGVEGVRIMLEPPVTEPDAYYTNMGNTNMIVPLGSATVYTAVAGAVAEVTWDPVPGTVYIQRSKDLTNWNDVRVALIGVTNFAEPIKGDKCFYRLRLGQP